MITEADNMAAVWKNYLRTGPRQLVVAGVIASERDRQRYERVRAAGPISPTDRWHHRGRSSSPTPLQRAPDQRTTWHLQRHGDLTQRLALDNRDELVIDTDELDPRSVAEEIVEHFGLLLEASTMSCKPTGRSPRRSSSAVATWVSMLTGGGATPTGRLVASHREWV